MVEVRTVDIKIAQFNVFFRNTTMQVSRSKGKHLNCKMMVLQAFPTIIGMNVGF